MARYMEQYKMNLAVVICQYRWASKRSLRELGTEIGLPASTLMRVEQGYEADAHTLAAILRWLLTIGDERVQRSPAHAKRKR